LVVEIHLLISDMKKVASELGKIPTRDEYLHLGIYKQGVIRDFGGYAVVKMAAFGPEKPPEPDKERLRPLTHTNTLITPPKLVRAHPQTITPTLFVSDTHFPYVYKDGLAAMYEFTERHKPGRIIQVGDLYDMFGAGRFPRSRTKTLSQDVEIELGHRMAKEMWETLKRICPKAECFQLLGNHDARPLKTLLAHKLEDLEVFLRRGIAPYYDFEGVTLIEDDRQELLIDGETVVIHGYITKLGGHLEMNTRNVVHGHSHRGGVFFRNVPLGAAPYGKTVWELDVGFIGDPETKAFSYTAQKVTKWTRGFGYLDQDGPRFIPL